MNKHSSIIDIEKGLYVKVVFCFIIERILNKRLLMYNKRNNAKKDKKLMLIKKMQME